jgi:hypothetical protein
MSVNLCCGHPRSPTTSRNSDAKVLVTFEMFADDTRA